MEEVAMAKEINSFNKPGVVCRPLLGLGQGIAHRQAAVKPEMKKYLREITGTFRLFILWPPFNIV